MPLVSRVLRNGESRVIPGYPDDLPQILADPAARLWVDIDTIDLPTLEEMGKRFGFHPLAIEDCHSAVQRPKVDEYPDQLFFSFHAIDSSGGGDVQRREIDGFLGRNYLVTVHEDPSPEVALLSESCTRNIGVLEKGADHLFYRLLDLMVDTHFPVLDRLEERVDETEHRLFTDARPEILEELFQMKKELLAIRRIVGPQRETIGGLSIREYPFITQQTRVFLRDVQDHLIRLTELVETYRDLVGGAMEAYWAETQQRMNQVMKILAVIGTLNLPLTLIAGLWGMNFDKIPWAHHVHGFWFILVLQVVIVGVMLVYFRVKKWL